MVVHNIMNEYGTRKIKKNRFTARTLYLSNLNSLIHSSQTERIHGGIPKYAFVQSIAQNIQLISQMLSTTNKDPFLFLSTKIKKNHCVTLRELDAAARWRRHLTHTARGTQKQTESRRLTSLRLCLAWG